MQDAREKQIRRACRDFLIALGEHVTDGDVFTLLANQAEPLGLRLTAHQRGINGTYIVFVDENS